MDDYPLDSIRAGRRADHQRPLTRPRASCSTSPCSSRPGDDGSLIAFFGSTIHHTDVGGYGIGAGGRDVFEEGLWIPICKLMGSDGERNDDVWKFILSNVRQPDHMAGDLHAQMASGEVGAQRLGDPV